MGLIEFLDFDIVFVGSGISCTAILLQILDKLNFQTETIKKPISIAVIEKNAEFWKGIPYGNRSLITALTITSLGEFVPASERESFINWLEETQEQWMANLLANGGATAASWLSLNHNSVKNKQWDSIYIPRYLFGEYLHQKVSQKIEYARQKGIATISLIHGEAVSVDFEEISYKIKIKKCDKNEFFSINAEKAIMCVGSPPFRTIYPFDGAGVDISIKDPYYPSMQVNFSILSKVLASIKDTEKRNIFILGTNASSLEILYHIHSNESLKKCINKIILLSGSGTLPYRITTDSINNHLFENLEKLKLKDTFASVDLMSAIEKDVSIASSKKINIGDMYYQLSDIVVQLLEKVGEKEKESFYCFSGAEFSKLIRRAGAEYRGAAAELEKEGKLEILKGNYKYAESTQGNDNEVIVFYEQRGKKEVLTIPVSFAILINCGGFEQLNEEYSSSLISSLIRKKLFQINCTNRGISVNENFEASKGLYVMGPLLGGIFNNKSRLWHVENAKSVFQLSELLSNNILDTKN